MLIESRTIEGGPFHPFEYASELDGEVMTLEVAAMFFQFMILAFGPDAQVEFDGGHSGVELLLYTETIKEDQDDHA